MNLDKKIFFNEYKNTIDPDRKLSQQEVNAINVFIDFVNTPLSDNWNMTVPQWSYFFATVFHETAHTFLPVKEAYWLSEEWRKKNLRYFPFYGRGYLQTTWKVNYQYYSKLLGVDFVNNPDLMMNPKYSFISSLDGFVKGRFTEKKISDYVNDKKKDYVGARRVINGTDKANLIAGYAKTFEKILNKSKLENTNIKNILNKLS